MPLKDVVRIIIDPRKVLQSRWAHDAAHLLMSAIEKAGRSSTPPRRRPS